MSKAIELYDVWPAEERPLEAAQAGVVALLQAGQPPVQLTHLCGGAAVAGLHKQGLYKVSRPVKSSRWAKKNVCQAAHQLVAHQATAFPPSWNLFTFV